MRTVMVALAIIVGDLSGSAWAAHFKTPITKDTN